MSAVRASPMAISNSIAAPRVALFRGTHRHHPEIMTEYQHSADAQVRRRQGHKNQARSGRQTRASGPVALWREAADDQFNGLDSSVIHRCIEVGQEGRRRCAFPS